MGDVTENLGNAFRSNRIVIAAPFGNYLKFPGTTPTLGTFTLNRRGGFWKRLCRSFLTLRYHPGLRGWTNRLGLPNPGVLSLANVDLSHAIVSVHGFSTAEWMCLAYYLATAKATRCVELNLSCPNVGHRVDVADVQPAVKVFQEYRVDVIAKLPPVQWMDYAWPLYHELGVTQFHCCNTLPTPSGGLSGKTLKQLSLQATEEVVQLGPGVRVTGGGGVEDVQDVTDYVSAGASRIAVGSMLFNPFNWRKLPGLVRRAAHLLDAGSKPPGEST